MTKFAENAPDLIESAIEGSLRMSAAEVVDMACTDWDEEAKSWRAVHEETYPSGKCGFQASLDEQALQLLWKKLPSKLRSKLDLSKISTFVDNMDDGMTLARAASAARIPSNVAVDLLNAIQGAGLL